MAEGGIADQAVGDICRDNLDILRAVPRFEQMRGTAVEYCFALAALTASTPARTYRGAKSDEYDRRRLGYRRDLPGDDVESREVGARGAIVPVEAKVDRLSDVGARGGVDAVLRVIGPTLLDGERGRAQDIDIADGSTRIHARCRRKQNYLVSLVAGVAAAKPVAVEVDVKDFAGSSYGVTSVIGGHLTEYERALGIWLWAAGHAAGLSEIDAGVVAFKIVPIRDGCERQRTSRICFKVAVGERRREGACGSGTAHNNDCLRVTRKSDERSNCKKTLQHFH